jgi:hypothetical protein
MAEYTRRVRTRTTVEYVIPLTIGFGACWAEIMKAIRASHSELWASGRVERGQDAPDDVIRFTVEDDAVIVFFEQDEVSDG